MEKATPDDPKGLIYEAFRIAGITKSECRTIFLDWALSLPTGSDTHGAMRRLLTVHGADADHPMSQVLAEGLHSIATPRRRGAGAAARAIRYERRPYFRAIISRTAFSSKTGQMVKTSVLNQLWR